MAGKASSASAAAPTRVLVGLGSNRWHGRHGPPERVLAAAVEELARGGLDILAVAPVIRSLPMGPSRRRYANGALLAEWRGTPMALMGLLKGTERAFGRRRGQRWGARVLDCDLLVFGHALIRMPGLIVPHPGLAHRAFVLGPVLSLWPRWRHPATGQTIRHMAARLAKPRRVCLSGPPGTGS